MEPHDFKGHPPFSSYCEVVALCHHLPERLTAPSSVFCSIVSALGGTSRQLHPGSVDCPGRYHHSPFSLCCAHERPVAFCMCQVSAIAGAWAVPHGPGPEGGELSPLQLAAHSPAFSGAAGSVTLISWLQGLRL